MTSLKRTKIVCTLGPSSHTEERLIELVEAGMNVCRLNFSHGTHEDHAELIRLIRSVAQKTGEPLAILQDLQGPKIRMGVLPEAGVELVAGQEIMFTTGPGDAPRLLPVTYTRLAQEVRPGERILLDDGLLSVQVLKTEGSTIYARVIDGGLLTSHKGLNLPDSHLSVPSLNEKDLDDLRFGVEQKVDWVAISFVRSAQDVVDVRAHLARFEQESDSSSAAIRLIAKIEKPEAIEHFDEILAVADGIMVARGDLGVELPAEQVPVLQKTMIAKCLAAAKPVIVATQMLNSMIHEPRPTRAEVSDIANAVIDHTDAVMLSGETATGEHPLEAVKIMSATIHETEKSVFDDLPMSAILERAPNLAQSNVAHLLATAKQAQAIVVSTLSGELARFVSRFRPEKSLFAFTLNERVGRQLNLSWGVRPMAFPDMASTAELLKHSFEELLQRGDLKKGEEVMVISGEPLGTMGHANLAEIRKA